MFGVVYHPELWKRHRWKSDARLMRQAGFKVVKLAEFAWEKIEPADGIFDFAWLDSVIGYLSDEGLSIVLTTPTAAPPLWLVQKHPEVIRVRADGVRLGPGGGHVSCRSNEVFRESVEMVIRAMAAHYRTDSGVIGWQIDSRLGNSKERLCHCGSCKERFHSWLERKFESIEALNEAWGTSFWSHSHAHFSDVPVPSGPSHANNPSFLLDWRRFCSDLDVEFQGIQAQILREECPDHFLTHNMTGLDSSADLFDLAADTDFASHDHQHSRPGRKSASGTDSAMQLDLVRAAKREGFWVMGQQSGAHGRDIVPAAPRPGQLRLWTAQSIAHGADTVVYSHWRTSLTGAEQLWHGILPHSGDPGRVYREIERTTKELGRFLETGAGSKRSAKVAILYSHDIRWALEIQPHHPEMSYVGLVRTFYAALHERNVELDFVSVDADFSGYRVLVAPALFLIDNALVARLSEFVESGGHLVATMRSGVKDPNNRVLPETLPGPLTSIFGLSVHEYDSLLDIEQTVEYESVEERVTLWADVIEPRRAEPMALYGRDYYAGRCAVAQHRFGEGTAYYVGTGLGPRIAAEFMKDVLVGADVILSLDTPEGVEAVVRRAPAGEEGTETLFLLNHTDQAQIVARPKRWKPVLLPEGSDGHRDSSDDLLLPAFELAVLERA